NRVHSLTKKTFILDPSKMSNLSNILTLTRTKFDIFDKFDGWKNTDLMKTPTDYRTKIERLYRRGWQFCWLPGYEHFGKRQEAYCRWRKSRIYWTFFLDYGQLDHWCPQDGIFAEALARSGPAEEVHNLWDYHRDELSNSAHFLYGGWRRWSGHGF